MRNPLKRIVDFIKESGSQLEKLYLSEEYEFFKTDRGVLAVKRLWIRTSNIKFFEESGIMTSYSKKTGKISTNALIVGGVLLLLLIIGAALIAVPTARASNFLFIKSFLFYLCFVTSRRTIATFWINATKNNQKNDNIGFCCIFTTIWNRHERWILSKLLFYMINLYF